MHFQDVSKDGYERTHQEIEKANREMEDLRNDRKNIGTNKENMTEKR